MTATTSTSDQQTFQVAMERRLADIDGSVGVMVHDHTDDRTSHRPP